MASQTTPIVGPERAPYLGIHLPQLATGGFYHLLHVGSVRRHPSEPFDRQALVSFQAKQLPGYSSAPLGSPLAQWINLRYAAAWRAGSVWTPHGSSVLDNIRILPAHRAFELRKRTMRLVVLEDILPPAAGPFVGMGQRPTWAARWEEDGVSFLVPCFELLRVFYYYAGPRLLDFFFSRAPVTSLGRVIEVPTPANAYQAHLCIAACALTWSEAQVVTELLLTPAYRRAVQRTHAALAFDWMRGQVSGHFKIGYPLGHDISVLGHGVEFTHGRRTYFWVGTLQLLANPFAFEHMLFHPLRSPSAPAGAVESNDAYTDVLAGLRAGAPPAVTPADLRHEPKEVAPTDGSWTGVHITRGFTWARSVPARKGFRYLGSDASLPWNKPSVVAESVGRGRPTLRRRWYEQVVARLRAQGYPQCPVVLNNAAGHYGAKVSLCEYGGHPPLRGAPYRHAVQTALLTAGLYGEGHFYLLHALRQQETALFCRRGLAPLTPATLAFILGQLASKQGDLRAVLDELQLARTRRHPDVGAGLLLHLFEGITPDRAVDQCLRLVAWAQHNGLKQRVPWGTNTSVSAS